MAYFTNRRNEALAKRADMDEAIGDLMRCDPFIHRDGSPRCSTAWAKPSKATTPAFAHHRSPRRTGPPLVILNSWSKARSPAPARSRTPDARRPTPDANHRPARYHHA